jgi:hypothetical protein
VVETAYDVAIFHKLFQTYVSLLPDLLWRRLFFWSKGRYTARLLGQHKKLFKIDWLVID